ncbi:MAG: hypothetical protein ACLFTU_08610 [Puniceicoccaceae bacterium]
MEWIRSPLVLVAFGAYALVLFLLLSRYFRAGEKRPAGVRDPLRGAEALPVREDAPAALARFREEAERLFAKEKEPVFASDADLRVFYRNGAARKLFGGAFDDHDEPLAAILGAEEQPLRKSIGDPDKPVSATVACALPNGRAGTAQVRVAILNRMPRVLAVRVTGLEESRPGWLSKSDGPAGKGSTSLTRGGHLDFREVDPASVELSADQMLGPLREIDDLLSKVSERSAAAGFGGGPPDPALPAARTRLRRMIRHIEEIDWMLQVTDGHLHLRPEPFRAHEVLAAMTETANRLSSADGPGLRLDPAEPPPVEPLLSGDRRVFEKILTQLLTSAFRSSGKGDIRVDYRAEPLESPTHSDDWYLFAGEDDARSQATRITIRIAFDRPGAEAEGSDLPAVIETLGAQIMDPKLARRLDFVRKGRDSDLFGLTLARELVGKLEGELAFRSDPEGRSEFLLLLQFDNA